jgi:uncharacterized protein YciI
MNIKIQLAGFLFVCLSLIACNGEAKPEANAAEEATTTITYDSTLAAKLGADEYGMKQYVMAFLKEGPNQSLDSAASAQLQRAHLDNIFRMADEGKLAVAGPFLDGGDLKGVYIFNVKTVEEAKALTESDPAVKAGRFVMELHPWYGSAATMMVNDLHKTIQKTKI